MGLAVLNLWFCDLLLFKIIYFPALGLSCSMQDLVPWPGIEPEPPALGVWSLSHWTAREVPVTFFLESAFSRAWASGPIEPGGTWRSGWRPRRQEGSLLRWACHQESQCRLLSQAGLCYILLYILHLGHHMPPSSPVAVLRLQDPLLCSSKPFLSSRPFTSFHLEVFPSIPCIEGSFLILFQVSGLNVPLSVVTGGAPQPC